VSGRFGLIARYCPHRGADLSCGTLEEQGIRCFYHGWKFDERGQCLEQPYEDIANPNPQGFGISQSKRLTQARGEAHAFGFVHQRMMTDHFIPIVPVSTKHLFSNEPAAAVPLLRVGQSDPPR